MSLATCPKCWNDVCTCGYKYKHLNYSELSGLVKILTSLKKEKRIIYLQQPRPRNLPVLYIYKTCYRCGKKETRKNTFFNGDFGSMCRKCQKERIMALKKNWAEINKNREEVLKNG